MDTIQGSRITYKRKRPNPLFQDWLEELYEEAKTKKSKLETLLKEALTSLSKYPLPLQSGAECAILKGFDKRLCIFLDKRLEVYKYNSQFKQPSKNSSSDSDDDIQSLDSENDEQTNVQHSSKSKVNEENDHITNSKSDQNIFDNKVLTTTESQSDSQTNICKASSDEIQSSRAMGRKLYRPGYRSGGYAILVALLEHAKNNPSTPSLKKDELIEKAQFHCEESFTRPKPDTFYTAWSNMTLMVTKGLVSKIRRKGVEYSLTEKGVLLAEKLLEEYSSAVSTNDIIFRGACTSETGNNDNIDIVSKDRIESNGQIIEAQTTNDVIIEMLAGTFDIILLIDKNETSGCSKKNDPTMAEFNKYPDLKHEYRSLKVGDFTWIARHKTNTDQELVLPYIVERKRMDDFGASIKDGRFHEQKFRLRKCGLKHVIYMVENYGSNKYVGLPIQSLMQALANTRVQDGFKVHMTDSLTNSARFLAMMSKRLAVGYKNKHLKGFNAEPKNDELMTFSFFNKSSLKNKPLTVTETFIKLLLQLKGVSVIKALAITNKYPTPSSLIKTYMRCSEKEGEMLLADLKGGSLNRNVGPIVSKSIYQLLANKDLV